MTGENTTRVSELFNRIKDSGIAYLSYIDPPLFTVDQSRAIRETSVGKQI